MKAEGGNLTNKEHSALIEEMADTPEEKRK
jgi:hypothetical protein